ncbi:MAG TPA: class I SAM-dependent methyltransferase [Pseudobacteroides sp.]|uniref:class I SAM-dependent methyltransferase n=1 Tax=Pseudobacteroides sp. TaxID=1968840 RepID=UPI002F92A0ED
MAFYEEISKYYDYIFPISKETVEFLRRTIGNPPKSVLDVACGTGGYSFGLIKHGYDVTAVDIDSSMIEGLRSKAKSLNVKIDFLNADMLDLKDNFNGKKFEAVFCIGNSVVHLDNLDQINEFFNNAKGLISEGGSLIVQVINYDRVISKGIRSLPTIYNEDIGLTFERLYGYDEEKNRVYFKTVLSVNDENYENEIPLYPLLYEDTKKMLIDAGFKNIEFFGDFNGSSYDKDNSFMMVLHALI